MFEKFPGGHYGSMYMGSMFGQPALAHAVFAWVIAHHEPFDDGSPDTLVELSPRMLGGMFDANPADVIRVLDNFCHVDDAVRNDGRPVFVAEGFIASNPVVGRFYRVLNGTAYSLHRPLREGANRGSDGGPTFVYFAVDELTGLVKVGFSRNPRSRVAGLRGSGAEGRCVLLAVQAGTRDDEKRLHHRFGAYWVRGEWFKHEGELATFIDALSSGGSSYGG